jgi:spermidine synthase
VPLLYFLTFLSGFAALVYQMLWIRELSLTLGSTTASICTVVAAFMGGLALGSSLIGRWIDRRRDALTIYALLELAIGLSALGLYFTLPPLNAVYPRLVLATSSSTLPVLRFLITFLLLLVPTSLMGGTFPVLVKVVTREFEHLGGAVGRLYGSNTIGAVAGCFAAGIAMIGALGLPGTYAVAIALNVAAAIGAWALSRSVARGQRPELAPSAAAPLPSSPSAADERGARAVLVAIGISGCVALGYEIVWSRALAIVLGHSIYAFTFVLSTYLAGLALGGFLAAPLLDRWKKPSQAFALGLLLLAVVSGASLYLIPSLPFREYELGISPWDYIAKNLGCTMVLLLPPTIVLGALLPLAIRACASSLERAGADVGRIYAWNTLGSILGSLLTGFALIPHLGTQVTLVILVLANLLLALAVGVRAGWPAVWTAASLLLALGGVSSLVSAQGSPILRAKALARVERVLNQKVELRFFGEDQVTSVGLIRSPEGLERLFTNGVLMTHWGIETLWMAHLPLAMVEEPRDVLVLCLGMGNTYRAAALHPVRVTAVELSPKVVEAFHLMHAGAIDPAGDDRIEVGDARNAVLVSDRQFDVITIDPPPPLYAAGTVNFHTREFFELCRARIRPGGVVCEWVPFFDCTVDEYKSIVRTFTDVFDRTWIWAPPPASGVTGLYLIGLGPEVSMDLERVMRRLPSPLVEADLRQFTSLPVAQFLPLAILKNEQVLAFCGTARALDDHHPFLEFPLFRNAGSRDLMRDVTMLPYVIAGK